MLQRASIIGVIWLPLSILRPPLQAVWSILDQAFLAGSATILYALMQRTEILYGVIRRLMWFLLPLLLEIMSISERAQTSRVLML